MVKVVLSVIAIFLVTSLSFAAPAVAQAAPASFAEAGCDAAALVAVTNEAGEVLYWTNNGGSGCDAQKRGGLREDLERAAELLAD